MTPIRNLGLDRSSGHVTDVYALVSATSIETGRFAAAERPVSRADLIRLIDQLSGGRQQQGYLEVRPAGDEFPVLLVGFRGGLAVVQRMLDSESMSILGGDGSVAGSDSIDILIMDDLATFTGEYVLGLQRAQEGVLQFLDGADLSALGEWNDL
jgi:hypothetical protein